MIMYKQCKHPITKEVVNCVERTTDNSFIPFDPANTDYQEYLKWIALGNEPLPADE